VHPAVVLSLFLLVLAIVGVFIGIPFVSNYAFWVVIAAYVIFDRGKNWLGMLSDLLLVLAVVGVFIDIPFVSNYAFWVAIAAYIIEGWNFGALVWAGVLSLLALGLAIVGVFIEIPFVSHYAFWIAIAAYIIRLVTKIPKSPTIPIRVSLGS
jgi:hypothetical protein